MLSNYLKIALRTLLRYKTYSFINIIGLAVGMAICLLMLLFIRDELSYDRFHTQGNQIYRIALERKYPGRSTFYAYIPQSMGEAAKKEFPEVQEVVRLFQNGAVAVRIQDRMFEENEVLFADENFFQVFSLRMLKGNARNALTQPNSVVLTETTARKYFGESDPLGKTLLVDQGSWLVSGVCQDVPKNSHFTFHLLASSATLPDIKQPDYVGFSAHTYLLLRKGASPAALEAKFPGLVEKYVAGEIERQMGVTFRQYQAAGNGYRYFLQPLPQIHLQSDLEAELLPTGSLTTVYTFSVIAVFILLLACINFMNLATARSLERAKEVGVRKTFGSGRKNLIGQFLMESVLISLLSMVITAGLVKGSLPFFNRLSGKHMEVHFFSHSWYIPGLIGFAILIGLLAGSYPAFVLSAFRPIAVLKGRFKTNRYGVVLRNGLVVFQFAVSVFLIICTIMVYQQMQYMQGKKLGFNKDHIITLQRAFFLGQRTKTFEQELMKIAGVQSVASCTAMPGYKNFFGTSWQPVGAKESLTGRGILVDNNYVPTMGLEIVAGRNFSDDFADSLSVLLNEAAVAEMGLKEPIGARLSSPDQEFNPDGKTIYTVVGVVKDFHFQSLHQKITPLTFVRADKFSFMALRIKPGSFRNTVAAIEQTWKKFLPEQPFHYSFLDEDLAALYQSEQRSQRIFGVFALLAIFIACIGLLGLAAYTTQQRTKEIAVRKVLGATVGDIATLLSKDFLRLVVLANVIAWPLAYFAMHRWLQDFAYRISIGWWVFLLAGISALMIAVLTVSFQAIKAALANPVKSLRTE